MLELVLTEEQMKIVAQFPGSRFTVKNPQGQLLGHLEAELTPEVIAELKKRAAKGPWFSSQQVQGRLRALDEEWERTGGFDENYMRSFLAGLDEVDPPRSVRPKRIAE